MKTIKITNGEILKIKNFKELAKIIRQPQHIDICNEKGERIEKKFFDFEIVGSKVCNISFC